MQNRYKNLWILGFILLIFFIPLWTAQWLYYKGSHLIQRTCAHGTLLKPSINLNNLPLKDLQGKSLAQSPFEKHWTLLSVSLDKTPKPITLKKLYTLRQIRLMLGKNSDKLQRVLILYPATSHNEITTASMQPYTGTLLLTLTPPKLICTHISSFPSPTPAGVYPCGSRGLACSGREAEHTLLPPPACGREAEHILLPSPACGRGAKETTYSSPRFHNLRKKWFSHH
jgi:hypothetical protein